VLLQLDAGTDQIRAYARQVEGLTLPLAPVLVYLAQQDAEAAAIATRQKRGAAWDAYLVDVVTHCPYAERRGLTGTSGVQAVVQAYRALLAELLAESRLPRVVLTDCASHWDVCSQQLRAFLAV
jgi:hypothetical protein